MKMWFLTLIKQLEILRVENNLLQESNNKLQAKITTVPFDPKLFEFKTEVKAITFHNLKLIQKEGEWETTIVLDV